MNTFNLSEIIIYTNLLVIIIIIKLNSKKLWFSERSNLYNYKYLYLLGFCIHTLSSHLIMSDYYILGQTTQRVSDVANVCYSGRSKVTFSIWPISAGEPNCE
jgi:hypothetical protein